MDTTPKKYPLFPVIKPYMQGFLAVGDNHEIYWEQVGNPNGVPVLYLHGGPGAGCSHQSCQFFDPDYYRIVVFDQRGAGRSKPFASIRANTTDHLVQDIEVLRQHLKIMKWIIFGGSWGATLALTYGVRYPARCGGLILRGIFLGSEREIKWFLFQMGYIFPEVFKEFFEFLPANERKDFLANYYRRLISADPQVNKPAAKAWVKYESGCSKLLVNGGLPFTQQNFSKALAIARIEAHYFMKNCFLPKDYLLTSIGAIRHIPAIIVHGRYDIICPIKIAFSLADRWPEAELIIIPDAGHSAAEPGTQAALVGATEQMKKYL